MSRKKFASPQARVEHAAADLSGGRWRKLAMGTLGFSVPDMGKGGGESVPELGNN